MFVSAARFGNNPSVELEIELGGLHSRARFLLVAFAMVMMLAGSGANRSPVLAQSWELPWDRPTVQREAPRRRPPPATRPRYDGPAGSRQYNNGRPAASYGANICLQLEQRLAREGNRGAGAQSRLANLRNKLRQADRNVRRYERELERRGCYEGFAFFRSLRRTPACRSLDANFRRAERTVESVQVEIRQAQQRGTRSYQAEIIRELARNNCGAEYQRLARRQRNRNTFRPFGGIWQDEDDSAPFSGGNTFGGLPFATYRTLCVRLCDGYYFPVSFSTLPNHFNRDAQVCEAKCAAPSQLYYHKNPGGSIDQMISHRTQQPYQSLRSAFKYRKEVVTGCSCKNSEYVPQNTDPASGQAGAGQDALASPRTTLPPGASGRLRDGISPVR